MISSRDTKHRSELSLKIIGLVIGFLSGVIAPLFVAGFILTDDNMTLFDGITVNSRSGYGTTKSALGALVLGLIQVAILSLILIVVKTLKITRASKGSKSKTPKSHKYID